MDTLWAFKAGKIMGNYVLAVGVGWQIVFFMAIAAVAYTCFRL